MVCEYYPRGNIIDHFAENVQAQTKSSSGHIQGAKNPAVRVRGFGVVEIMVGLSMLVFAMFLS